MAAVREPAAAGTFYEDDPEELKESIEASFLGPFGPGRLPQAAPFISRDVVAIVSPHAGYRFSGYAAASAFFEVAEDGIPSCAVIIGPNHRGVGRPAAVASEGAWRTPLGDVEIDSSLAAEILAGSEYLATEASAHRLEHSIEVQLPFLQYIAAAETKIVPIAISALSPEDSRKLTLDLGNAIASALSERNGIVIASTDFTHYEPQSSAIEKDKLAIRAIQELDAVKLLECVEHYNITMCGAVPTAVALQAAKGLGALRADLLSYYTSGDILGDNRQVVGYAALKIVKSD